MVFSLRLTRSKPRPRKNRQQPQRTRRQPPPDIETLLDYKGLLIGFDYQTSSQVYIVYTEKLGVIVWYKHDSYGGKLCPSAQRS